ncbi:MAG: flagellar hook-associated protein FlgK [Rhodobacteraceae bacterium]|jgi:flagellar hook-associated protein 1 FlgK|nr:flagellar hook-associated protein FlgK [Paracoccaceae bacterium]
MSISSSLTIALSGLTATGKSAEVVSGNVANALTDGYGVRRIELAARLTGSSGTGVRVANVLRDVDVGLLNSRRDAQAEAGGTDRLARFLASFEAAVGAPDDAASLSGRIAMLEATLVEAASRPDVAGRLDAAVGQAKALATRFVDMSRDVQQTRTDADAAIADMVDRLNAGLSRVSGLNALIQQTTLRGSDPTALMDERQRLVDSLSDIVPLREVARPNGTVALYTPGGGLLLDGSRPALIGFTPTGMITEDMTLAAGSLSGLTLNGTPVTVGERGPLSGGDLAAAFRIRDGLGPQAQSRLDAMARDLIDRFQDPAVDATRAPGGPGLFTDIGAPFAVANEPGIATRIRLNAQVDPAVGGASWRLRDGLGAATPGDVGNARLLNDLRTALTAPRTPASGDFGGAARGLAGRAGDLLAATSGEAQRMDQARGFADAALATLRQAELERGVDTDAEMERLLLIEQAYAANARVIQAAEDMLDQLLRIG